MKKHFVSSLVLFLLVSCSSSTPNLITDNTVSLNNDTQFNTKALTKSYLKKKMDKWLSDTTKYSKNLTREVEYAKFKHPTLLQTIVTETNSVYDSIIADSNVIQKRSVDTAFNTYITSLNPYINTTINYASTATAVASNSYNASQAPSYALDADNNSQWGSGTGALPQWIRVNLGQQRLISKVIIRPTDNTWYNIQGSNDGTNFTNIVGSVYAPAMSWKTSTFTLVRYQYVRIYAYNCGGWVAIKVIQIY